MIELFRNQLRIQHPEVHPKARLTLDFQRTLRIPDDGRDYPLPPGLGRFPLFHVDDYGNELPAAWVAHGGIFFPMHQAEAMWISFEGNYPFAVKVATGKVNAVNGQAWTEELVGDPQDYLVVPDQPWLDGYNVGHGRIRQFVAAPLGEGSTVEEQVTGEAVHGGLQILAYPMKPEVYDKLPPPPEILCDRVEEADSDYEMGLAPGGLMRQQIFEDQYGRDAWEQGAGSRCFVHVVNSARFRDVTGYAPPQEPPTAEIYTAAGLPWFEFYEADKAALDGAPTLMAAESMEIKTVRQRRPNPEDHAEIQDSQVQRIRR